MKAIASGREDRREYVRTKRKKMLKVNMIPRIPRKWKPREGFTFLHLLACIIIALLLVLTGEIIRQGRRVDAMNTTIMELRIGNH